MKTSLSNKIDSVFAGKYTDEELDKMRLEAIKKAEKDYADGKRKYPYLNAIEEVLYVHPNRHVGKDILSNPFTGSYEHKDPETGKWLPGPALGHHTEDACGEYLSKTFLGKINSLFD